VSPLGGRSGRQAGRAYAVTGPRRVPAPAAGQGTRRAGSRSVTC